MLAYTTANAAAVATEFARLGAVWTIKDNFGYLEVDSNGVGSYTVVDSFIENLQALDDNVFVGQNPIEEYAEMYEAIGLPEEQGVMNDRLEADHKTITSTGGWSQTGDDPLEYWVNDTSAHIVIDYTLGRYARQYFETLDANS
jgi:hypothetical protein